MPQPPIELLRQLNEIVQEAQLVLAEWTDPRGDADTRDRLLALLDGPDLLALQARIAEAVSERPLFFVNDR